MKRRKFIKRTIGGLLSLGLFSAGGYFYAREVEPRLLKLSHFKLASRKVPKSFHNFKILQFSDTHIGFHYDLSELERLVEKINDEKADLIVFTGDLIDQPNTFEERNKLSSLLKDLHAPYGKFWVFGNHDHGGYGTEAVKDIMKQADFTLLKNEYTFIEKNKEKILILGVDDLILGRPDLNKALPEDYQGQNLSVLLAHEPDFADLSKDFPIDIQLSGHSHGGQVRLPLIGHLYTPIFAKKYIQGKYALRNGSFLLYVNPGIGTTRLPLRIFCKPEIYLFTLQRK